MERRWQWLLVPLLLLLLATACSRPALPPPSTTVPVAEPVTEPKTDPPPAQTPAKPDGAQAGSDAARAGPGWQKLLTGAYTLARVEPDGQGFYLVREGGDTAQRISLGDPVRIEPAQAPPDRDRVLSPDATRAAWVENRRLVVGDLRTGEQRVLTTPAEPAPPNLVRYQHWVWVGNLYWSPDGQWLYFTSTRTDPSSFRFWRVPADGSKTEELLPESQVFVTGRGRYGSILRLVDPEALPFLPETGTDRRPIAPGEHLDLNLSPDGGKVAVYLHAEGRFVIYDLDRPSEPLLSVTLPTESFVVENAYFATSAWSPDGKRVLLQLRGANWDLSQWLAVLEARPEGSLTLYGLDDPSLGLLQPLGWINANQVLVRSSHWDTGSHWPAQAPPDLFLLDLRQARPPLVTTPIKLVAVRVTGGREQNQNAGEAMLLGEGGVILKFDRPLSPQWVSQHVMVEGSGARLVTSAASLGLVTIRLEKGREGEDVVVRVPTFDHILRVSRAERVRATAEMRQGDGPWGPLDATRIHPRTATEVRFRFSKPVRRELVDNLMANGLQGVKDAVFRWTENDLLVQMPEPPPVLQWQLEGDLSQDGSGFDLMQTQRLFFGSPPRLMAADAEQPAPALPPSIASAYLATDGQALLLTWYAGNQSVQHSQLDLQSGAINPVSPEETAPSGRRLGDRVASLEAVRFTGSAGVYHYETRLVIPGQEGRELLRSDPLQSYYPPGSFFGGAEFAWSPDGRQVGVLLASTSSSYRLFLVDAATGTVRPLGDSLADGGRLIWSPRGRHLLVGRQVVEYATGQVIRTLEPGAHFRWSPTGEQVLYNRQEWGEVVIVSLTSGEIQVLGRGLPAGWDPSGQPFWIEWELAERRIRPIVGP